MQVSSSSTSVTASENTTESNRSGSVTFVQENSGKQVTLNLTQTKLTVNIITFKQQGNLLCYDVIATYPLASDVFIDIEGSHMIDDTGAWYDFTETFKFRKGDTEYYYYYDQMDLQLAITKIRSISPTKDHVYRYEVKVEPY